MTSTPRKAGAASPSAGAPDARWTTRALLDWMTTHFRERGVDSPRVCAEMLLAHVFGCERMRLYMEVDRPASGEERERLRALVSRAAQHEPVQYLVGHAWFFSRAFEVDRSTLIPRPSTETLVESILAWTRERGVDAPSVLDVGTGTGCIAVSLAAALPSASIVATDLVSGAIELAGRNAAAHGVDGRVDLRSGDLWDALVEGERFDVIASNPPYIPDHEWADVARNVREWEPSSALRGGVDGLDVVRRLIAGATDRLQEGGLLAVELAASHAGAAEALAREAGLLNARVERDSERLPRVLLAERSPLRAPAGAPQPSDVAPA